MKIVLTQENGNFLTISDVTSVIPDRNGDQYGLIFTKENDNGSDYIQIMNDTYYFKFENVLYADCRIY